MSIGLQALIKWHLDMYIGSMFFLLPRHAYWDTIGEEEEESSQQAKL